MKTSVIQYTVILLCSGIFLCCSEKNDNPSAKPKEIIAWEKPINFRNDITYINSLSVKSDEGFLVSGNISYTDNNEIHGVILNLNSTGDTIWCNQIDIEGYPRCEVFYALEKSPEEIIIAGLCNLFGEQTRFLIWLDANGKVARQLLLPVLTGYHILDCKLFLLENGNICYASHTCLNEDLTMAAYTLRMEQFNNDGQNVGSELFPNVNCTLSTMIQTGNGNFLMTGITYAGGNNDNIDMLFMLTNQSGALIYRTGLGTDSWDVGESVCNDFENGYYVSGSITYSNTPVIYPVNSSGVVGPYTTCSDTIYSYGTLLKKATEGYLLFLQSFNRLYFVRMDSELKVKYTTWYDCTPPLVLHSTYNMCITLLKDGSFAFIYYSDKGNIIIKTKTV